MPGKFRNKYRIESSRAQWWDYSWDGYYFITICTYQRQPFFGSVIKNQTQLTSIGKIAFECWKEIPHHFPFVKLHNFVIMPNHIHGIIVIDKENKLPENNSNIYVKLFNDRPAIKNKFGPQSKNLGSIIRGYKIGVKKIACTIIDFDWQRRYDDHIIRSRSEYIAISKYILNNPSNWNEDEFFI